MRKLIAGLVLIFAAAFVVGSVMAESLPRNCFYDCDCLGNPVKCCTHNGVTTCKPSNNIGCPPIVSC